MRVLIVEDDPAIAANLYDYLEAAGYLPEHAADGVTGLHRAVSAQWSAIRLDVSLPGMDGFTLCRKLREEARLDTPVLMLMAKDTLDDKLAGFSHGADDQSATGSMGASSPRRQPVQPGVPGNAVAQPAAARLV